jgi:hypothetical protein
VQERHAVGHKIQDATEYTNHVLEHDHAASAASAHRDYCCDLEVHLWYGKDLGTFRD